MNSQNMRLVASTIERLPGLRSTDRLAHETPWAEARRPDAFCMAVYEGAAYRGRGCLTVACMAGVCAWMAAKDGPVQDVAAEFLGLDELQADALFKPFCPPRSAAESYAAAAAAWRDIEPRTAACVLRDLGRQVETGKHPDAAGISAIWAARLRG